MKIICDSREHWTHPTSTDTHISGWFDKHGIEWTVQKLDVGDYAVDGCPAIVVDRKASLQEVAQNLFARNDKARFWREVRRAKEQGIKLIVLVEDSKCKTIQDVANWQPKYGKVTGRTLMNEMYRVHISYGVEFMFCNRRSTARRIVELLTEGETNGRIHEL